VAAAVKRSIDIVGAAVGIVLFLPLLLVAVVAIRVDSPGAAVFRQVRVGRHGRHFTTYKLRTMVVDNDDTAHQSYIKSMLQGEGSTHDGIYKLTNDPRITKVGRFLRRMSIDEIPQLFNVLRGHMSLVGPRPPLPSEADLYDARAWGRLSCPPGITGLWQVSGRCELSYLQMIELDLEYARTWRLGLDLRILAKTPLVAISRRGAA
jgi:lipopolysaccharide/colanic/teichoic acid biosynthesis glycosyltransferase